MESAVRPYHGVPTLFIDGAPMPGFAYITYRTANNRYSDFASLGCTLYSVPVFFGGQTINETTQIPPMAEGIFDGDTPDFSHFDADIARILDACPTAYIFPRVNVSVPRKWEQAHPDECCDFGYTEHRRACFSSDAWAEETCRLLEIFIDHVRLAPYADHIVGYQIAGGNTEEWFPFDMRGSVGKRSREAFARYCRENDLAGDARDQKRFWSEMTARRILQFCACAKRKTARRQVIGCFYGYTMECPAPEQAHHALGMILASDDVDFICSPVSYAGLRPVGADHANMLPVDSVKLHGKLYFAENDTRTHLSCAPNAMPAYNGPIWFGPAAEQTLEIIRMHFSRALTHGHAMWWFDMWGGWYDDDRYRDILKKCRTIFGASLERDRSSCSEIAVFVDECAYAEPDAVGSLCYGIRRTLGSIGAPYDIYLIDDYRTVAHCYKACVFLQPVKTAAVTDAADDAKARALVITADDAGITAAQIRDFCMAQGVHIWCPDTVVYAAGDYVFFHACRDGLHEIALPKGIVLRDLFTGEICRGVLSMHCGDGHLYLTEPKE